MGLSFAPWYGESVGSAVKEIELTVEKIKTNKFTKKDLLKLHNANAELIKALLEDDKD